MPFHRAELMQFLVDELSRRIGPEAVSDEQADLFELGLDSIEAVELTGEIEQRFGIELDPVLVFEARSIAGIAERVMEDASAQ
jgi:acyl carrier protein